MGRVKIPWLRWLLGAAILTTVMLVVARVSEARAFVRLAAHARPLWLLVALALQAATYLFQSEVWQTVLRPARAAVALAEICRLSVARLFVDQVVPSAGLSGTVVAVRALERLGVPRPVVMAGVVVETTSLYATYAIGLVAASIVTLMRHAPNRLILPVVLPLFLFAVALSVGFLAVSGRPAGTLGRRLAWLRPLEAGRAMLAQADRRLARSPRSLLEAGGCQAAVVLLDAATMWAVIASLGVLASPSGVFASYMISTLLRLVGVLPGGLGVFEATSVLTLKLMGVELPVALSATLLFRGLSFWLPLAPGLWFSRRFLA